jgi:hypothetical protein
MRKYLCIAVTSLFFSACSTLQPIYNVESASVPANRDGTPIATTDVARAIHSAASHKGWTAKDITGTQIQASIVVRGRHEATVDISFDSEHYSIQLKRTNGLDQSNGKIHRNYNKWIILLSEEIASRLDQMSKTGSLSMQEDTTSTANTSPSPSISKQLEAVGESMLCNESYELKAADTESEIWLLNCGGGKSLEVQCFNDDCYVKS